MIKAADVKLKPCPFCKGEVELWKYSEAIKCRFICKKCKVEVEFPRGLDSKDCIKKWNRRDTQNGITVGGGNDILYPKGTKILDLEIPSLTIPVKPGRNLAVIIEVAAMNSRQKKLGYNAAQDLLNKLGMNDDAPAAENDNIDPF